MFGHRVAQINIGRSGQAGGLRCDDLP